MTAHNPRVVSFTGSAVSQDEILRAAISGHISPRRYDGRPHEHHKEKRRLRT